MGTAPGFAMTRPAYETVLVFVALGIGFALPMLLLSLRPVWLRWLPKPGAWMERLRKLMAFPLYATAAWLVWVLSQQVDATAFGTALAGSVLMAFGLWLFGQSRPGSRLRPALLVVPLIATAALVVTGNHNSPPKADKELAAESWTPARVSELQNDGQAVLVNFTAAWCITCKVNEQVALTTPAVRTAMADHSIAYLKADWTRRDPTITQTLQRHGRSGVPLYLLYPAGHGEPLVMPQLLTEGLVLQAIEDIQSRSKS